MESTIGEFRKQRGALSLKEDGVSGCLDHAVALLAQRACEGLSRGLAGQKHKEEHCSLDEDGVFVGLYHAVTLLAQRVYGGRKEVLEGKG